MNININGISYDLNTEVETVKKVVNKCIKENSENLQIRAGQRYLDKDNNMTYILARVIANEVCLINLLDGNRFNNPVKTRNIGFLTNAEWALVSKGGKFIRIK